MIQKLNLTFLLLIAASQLAFSQYNTPVLVGSTGYYQSVSGYSVSYSVGEMAVTTESNSNYIITQGFQQPDTSRGGGGGCVYDICPEFVKVYPNPVQDFLTIHMYKNGINTFHIEIYNMKGKKVRQGKMEGVTYGETRVIDLSEFVKEIYIIRVFSADGKLYDKFKIIKI